MRTARLGRIGVGSATPAGPEFGEVVDVASIAVGARRASRSPAAAAAARFGLAARAVVYILIGWLAVQIATGHHGHEANQRGALAEIGRHSYGLVLLWAMGLGFAAYALWRLTEACLGTATDGPKVGPRLQSLARGVIYAGFSVGTFTFIAGTSHQGQSQQQATLTARVMRHTGGRWLVGAAGVVVVAVGAALVAQGLTRKFERDLRMHEMSEPTRRVVVTLGTVGTVARGVVFAVAGGLVVDAAVTFKASKSTGLDGALRTLADQAYGPWVLGAFAVGLIAFGAYGLAAARWAKT
jgi:hypothetical protein